LQAKVKIKQKHKAIKDEKSLFVKTSKPACHASKIAFGKNIKTGPKP